MTKMKKWTASMTTLTIRRQPGAPTTVHVRIAAYMDGTDGDANIPDDNSGTMRKIKINVNVLIMTTTM